PTGDRRALPARLYRERLALAHQLLEQRHHAGCVPQHLDVDLERRRLAADGGLPDRLEQPGHQGAERQLVEEEAHLLAIACALPELRRTEVELEVAAQA